MSGCISGSDRRPEDMCGCGSLLLLHQGGADVNSPGKDQVMIEIKHVLSFHQNTVNNRYLHVGFLIKFGGFNRALFIKIHGDKLCL